MPIIFQNVRHLFLELFCAKVAPKVRYYKLASPTLYYIHNNLFVGDRIGSPNCAKTIDFMIANNFETTRERERSPWSNREEREKKLRSPVGDRHE